MVLLKAGEILLQRSKTKVLHERLACEKHIAINSNMGHHLLVKGMEGSSDDCFYRLSFSMLTGEACLAKPSVERLPKAKTPFRLLLIVLTEGGL